MAGTATQEGKRRGGKRKGSSVNALRTDSFVFYSPFFERTLRTWYCRKRDCRTDKVTRVRLRAETKTDAKQEVNELWKEQLDREGRPQPGESIARQTLDKAFRRWFSLQKGGWSDSTASDLRYLCGSAGECGEVKVGAYAKAFEQLGKQFVDEVRLRDIEELFLQVWSNRKGQTLVKHYQYFKTIFAWCTAHGYCKVNPIEGFKPPKAWRRDIKKSQQIGQALEPDQARALLIACREPYKVKIKGRSKRRDGSEWTQTYTPPPHLYTAALIGLRSGLRRGNIMGMRWSHLDLGSGIMHFDADEIKNREDFEVPIHPELWQHLREVLNQRVKELGHAPSPSDPVISLKAVEFKKSFKGALKRAKLWNPKKPFRIHDLRHVFTTDAEKYCTFAAVQQLLGHTQSTVTQRYIHLSIEDLRREIEKIPWLMERSEGSRVPQRS